MVERLARLADASPGIVFITAVDGACTFANRRWTEVTVQSIEDALGYVWRRILHPDDLEAENQSWIDDASWCASAKRFAPPRQRRCAAEGAGARRPRDHRRRRTFARDGAVRFDRRARAASVTSGPG
jgi:PAS domain-containing protein